MILYFDCCLHPYYMGGAIWYSHSCFLYFLISTPIHIYTSHSFPVSIDLLFEVLQIFFLLFICILNFEGGLAKKLGVQKLMYKIVIIVDHSQIAVCHRYFSANGISMLYYYCCFSIIHFQLFAGRILFTCWSSRRSENQLGMSRNLVTQLVSLVTLRVTVIWNFNGQINAVSAVCGINSILNSDFYVLVCHQDPDAPTRQNKRLCRSRWRRWW